MRELHGNARGNTGFYAVDWKYVNTPDNEVELWYALPDIIASKIKTGKAPEIVQAIRFIPTGTREGLQATRLPARWKLTLTGMIF